MKSSPTASSCVFAGRATVDLVYQLDDYPVEDTKVMASASLVQPGGPALNAAITYAFLGGNASLISAIGRAPLSRIIIDELDRHAVAFMNRQNSSLAQPPLSSIILNSHKGTRTIFNSPAAALEDGWQPQAAPLADMLLLDGFYIPQLRSVIEHFVAAKRPICLDGGSWRSTTEALLPFLSVVICSERFLPPGVSSTAGVIGYLHDRGVAKVAITRGARAIAGSDSGGSFEIPVAATEAIDTLGAGDIFHGAFCWYYLTGNGFAEALRRASEVATLSCRYLGTRRWMQHFDQEVL